MSIPNFCPRCGKPLQPNESVCSNCGLDFKPQDEHDGVNPYAIVNRQQISLWEGIRALFAKIDKKLFLFCILAVAVLGMCFWSAYDISHAAGQILQIRTSEGHTVSEVYYRDMGGVYHGIAVFFRACGIFFAGILVKCGLSK